MGSSGKKEGLSVSASRAGPEHQNRGRVSPIAGSVSRFLAWFQPPAPALNGSAFFAGCGRTLAFLRLAVRVLGKDLELAFALQEQFVDGVGFRNMQKGDVHRRRIVHQGLLHGAEVDRARAAGAASCRELLPEWGTRTIIQSIAPTDLGRGETSPRNLEFACRPP